MTDVRPYDEELPWLQAVELCKVAASPDDWGLVSAKWVLPDGSDPSTIMPASSIPKCATCCR